ncbi:MAG: acyl-CoA/acyl-ACP dehydrogenase [Deltaproteobacteria bacterium]|jgi:alkylation response protein AidB-like acyl-CoA dehydrogenase|nr:acyl-CoA/acyl-ACP dehydrogenase [Deltaproteobacteria bacterium]
MVDFGYSKDQEMIRKSVRKFLEKECPMDNVRALKTDAKGYDVKVWKKMVDLGFVGMAVSEAYDGMGGEYLELMIFMEEAGRNLLPSPYFTSVVLCGLPIERFGSAAQKESCLPAIADGQIWSLALMEEAADYEAQHINLAAVREGDVYTLNGTKLFVPFAAAAEKLLVAARTQAGEDLQAGITFFIVDSDADGVSMEMIPTAAGDQRYEIRFDKVVVPAENIIGRADGGWEIVEYLLLYAAVLKCAEMSGGAQAVLEMTRRYAAERIQFDKPIGSMQAIQHRLSNAFIGVQALKNLVYEAAWYLNAGLPRPDLVSMAKVKANTVFQNTCIEGITIHGAIGFTEEMDVGMYHLRTKAMEFDLGGSEFHRERIMRELEQQVPDYLSL